jgi:hypothetical protein
METFTIVPELDGGAQLSGLFGIGPFGEDAREIDAR